jgi:hypothetical protein
MEIDVFFKNDDMSFGFTGEQSPRSDEYSFSDKVEFGFPNVDYSYADGSKQNEAYGWSIGGLKEEDKSNCEVLKATIAAIEDAITADKRAMVGAKKAKKEQLQAYIDGRTRALNELKAFYDKSQCELKFAQKAEEDFQSQLNKILGAKSDSKVGMYVLIGGVVVAVGVLGFFIYRRYKK